MNSFLDQNNVEFIECIVPDINGIGKGKTVPRQEFINGEIRLPEAIFGQDIVGQWSENYDLLKETDIDMVLVPEPSALVSQPWSKTNTAQCICDCIDKNGNAIDIAPRSILKKIIGLFDHLGIQPVVAQEAEFYLVAQNPDPMQPLQAAIGRSGRQQKVARSYQVEALAEYAPFLETLERFAKAQNIKTAGVVQEMGPGQLEVNFNHGNALDKADEMFNFKRIVRQAAIENGFYATFLAKPMSHQPGSAMHLHQSLIDKNTGENVFVNTEGSHSEKFWSYLGGLQKYTDLGAAFFAPHVNSYRRFEGAASCPTNVEWGFDNRTTGFRIPISETRATRIENRIPGADTNPYLAIAVNLACGYLGMQENLTPHAGVEQSAWDLPYSLPHNLPEALIRLGQCDALIEILGERFVTLFIDIKSREASDFAQVVTSWEREHLLLTV